MLVKLSPIEISAFLLTVFGGVYLNIIQIPPVYVAFFLGIVFLFLGLVTGKKIYAPKTIFLTLFYVLYIVFSQSNNDKTSAYYNVLFSLAYFLVMCVVTFSISKETLIKYSIAFIRVSLFLLIIECVWRISHPIFRQGNIGNIAFYRYKYNSIMFQDSNYVGVFALVLLFLMLYLEKKGISLTIEKIICFVLIVLTISRSAILAAVVFYFLFEEKIRKSWKTVLGVVGLIVGIFFVFNYIAADASYLSKFAIINKAWDFFRETTIRNRLFGIGFGNTVNYIGIGSHNFLVTYILETGIVGFVMLCILWIQIIYESRKKSIIIMFPFLVAGFSMAQHYLPFLYSTYAIIIALERSKNYK